MSDDLAGMGHEKAIKWYLAKDGQQYRPLTHVEMEKFDELGHLRANDLVWRKGFPDWRPAGEVFDIARRGLTTP
jgi:uncharacterized protein DUF4339